MNAFLSLLARTASFVLPAPPHVTPSELILSGFVAASFGLIILAEHLPRPKRRDGEEPGSGDDVRQPEEPGDMLTAAPVQQAEMLAA